MSSSESSSDDLSSDDAPLVRHRKRRPRMKKRKKTCTQVDLKENNSLVAHRDAVTVEARTSMADPATVGCRQETKGDSCSSHLICVSTARESSMLMRWCGVSRMGKTAKAQACLKGLRTSKTSLRVGGTTSAVRTSGPRTATKQTEPRDGVEACPDCVAGRGCLHMAMARLKELQHAQPTERRSRRRRAKRQCLPRRSCVETASWFWRR